MRISSRALAAALAALSLLPAVAGAHAELAPAEAARGSSATFELEVPDERGPDDPTARIAIKVPADAIVPNVEPKPSEGWQLTVTRRPLDAPVLVDGEVVADVVDTIVYTADEPGATPSVFRIRMGPLPGDAEALVFKVVQDYASGAKARWIEPEVEGQPEPELPAPTIALTGEAPAFALAPQPDAAPTEETAAASTVAPDATTAAPDLTVTLPPATTEAATTAQPTPATTAAVAAAPAAAEDDGGSRLPAILGAAGVVLVVAAAIALRGRGRGDDD